MSSKRSTRPWQSATTVCRAASGSRSNCSSARETSSASVPSAPIAPSKDSDGVPKDGRTPRKCSGNGHRCSDGEGSVDERRRTASAEDPHRVATAMIAGLAPSRPEIRSDALRNAEGLQTILCAQLLSSLARGNAQQNVTAPWQKEMTDDAVALRAKIYDDPEVNDFTCRLVNFSKGTGITPPVILSYVMNETPIHPVSTTSNDAPVVHVDHDGQLNHVLFDLLWRKHVAGDTSISRVASNRGGGFSAPSPDGVTGKDRDCNESGETKKTTRQEAKQRWMKKREKRSFSARIRYPARQHLANARKRHKGQFVSNKISTAPAPTAEENVL